MKLEKKRIPTPEWFAELYEHISGTLDELAKVLKLDPALVRARRGIGLHAIITPKLVESLNRGQKERVSVIIDYGNSVKNYAFQKLKFEMFYEDPDIFRAEQIRFDSNTKEIVVMHSVRDVVRQNINKFAEELSSVLGIKTEIQEIDES